MRRFAFRVDASPEIGIGHLMRCLTLADALHARGAQCLFLSRERPGGWMERASHRGHDVRTLKSVSRNPVPRPLARLPYEAWLGVDWQTDAEESGEILGSAHPDWLVVDHYALDERWEKFVGRSCSRVAVIDDLVDRPHDCDLLLDQTLGRLPRDYRRLVPERCTLFTGAAHALLRPEFAQLREHSLARRRAPRPLRHLLVTMGGVDPANATGRVLEAMTRCNLPHESRISIVMGASAPWLGSVRAQAAAMPWPTEVLVDVTDMATLLSEADLSIGAAGTTSWERCCLGVPALILVLAQNQLDNAAALAAAGAAVVLDESSQSAARIALELSELVGGDRLQAMSDAASRITDGLGLHIVTRHLLDAP